MQVSPAFSSPGMDKILSSRRSFAFRFDQDQRVEKFCPADSGRDLLTREPCVLHRVPDLSDTNYMLQILTHLGAQVERASGTVTVTAEKIESVAPYDVVRKMRASVCVLGRCSAVARKRRFRCRAAASSAIGRLICI